MAVSGGGDEIVIIDGGGRRNGDLVNPPSPPDPDALPPEDQCAGAPGRADPLYFLKRKLAFFVEQGRKRAEITRLLGISDEQYKRMRRDPLTKRFRQEFAGKIPDPQTYMRELLKLEEPHLLERHIEVAMSPKTPPQIANDARKDLLDRGGTVRRQQESGPQAPVVVFNVEQLNLLGSSIAHELALPAGPAEIDITPEKAVAEVEDA